MPSIASLFALALLGFALCAVPSQNRRSRQTETEGSAAVPAADSAENEVVTGSPQDQDEDGDGLVFRFDFGNPFAGFDSMIDRFRRLEQAMHAMQSRLFNFTSSLPTTYDNSTEEIVEIGGHRYRLIRKVITKGDNDSSVLFSATSLTPVDRRKRELTDLEGSDGGRVESDSHSSESAESENKPIRVRRSEPAQSGNNSTNPRKQDSSSSSSSEELKRIANNSISAI